VIRSFSIPRTIPAEDFLRNLRLIVSRPRTRWGKKKERRKDIKNLEKEGAGPNSASRFTGEGEKGSKAKKIIFTLICGVEDREEKFTD